MKENKENVPLRQHKYSEEFKKEVLEYAKNNTIVEACIKFNVSRYAINEWKGWIRKNKKESSKKWYDKHGHRYCVNKKNHGTNKFRPQISKEESWERSKIQSKKRRKNCRFLYLSAYSNQNFKKKGIKNFYELTAGDLWKIAKKQKLLCVLTGIKLTRENMSVDHIIPMSKGGSNEPQNIRLVDKDVNLARRALTDEQFFALCRNVISYQERVI